MKVLVYTELAQEHQDELKKLLPPHADIVFQNDLSEVEFKDKLSWADVLIGNPPAELLVKSKVSVKFWQLENVGFEQYKDVDFKGTVANVGDMSAVPCAETIVGGVLAFYRGIHSLVREQLQQRWVGEKVADSLHILGEKKVVILGSGAIGEHVAKILAAFGCSVKMTAKSDASADIHSREELMKALPDTDLVINTLPGSLEKYVSAAFFEKMKKGALYASVGRGNTTDESALVRSLESGQLIGAVLDVTATEPLPANRKLWKMNNVILTQHSGAAHKDRDRDKVRKFAENVNQFLKGGKVKDEVKLSDGY